MNARSLIEFQVTVRFCLPNMQLLLHYWCPRRNHSIHICAGTRTLANLEELKFVAGCASDAILRIGGTCLHTKPCEASRADALLYLPQGSTMYFARGFLPIMYKDLTPHSFRLANVVGFGVGSMMLMAGGYLLILKMIAREDDPELELHQRLQAGDEEAMNGKLLAMAEVRRVVK